MRPRAVGIVAHAHVEDLHRVVVAVLPGDEQRLAGGDALVFAGVGGIAQPVAAGVLRAGQVHARGLPADGPVFARIRVLQIHVVPGEVHGHAVGPEAGDAVELGRIQPAVAPRVVGEHRAHPLGAQVVGHGKGRVHPVDHVLPGRVVKVTVAHVSRLLAFIDILPYIHFNRKGGKRKWIEVAFVVRGWRKGRARGVTGFCAGRQKRAVPRFPLWKLFPMGYRGTVFPERGNRSIAHRCRLPCPASSVASTSSCGAAVSSP